MVKRPRIGVLMGGRSAEREVSLASGKNVAEALMKKEIEVVEIEIADDGRWTAYSDKKDTPAPVSLKPASFEAANRIIDVVFIALHGPLGEDGTVQGVFEVLGVPYTGSGVLSSALAMNKLMTKRVFLQENIATPNFLTVSKTDWEKHQKAAVKKMVRKFGLPLVVKPCGQGSSIGVSIAKNEAELKKATAEAFSYGQVVLAEEYLEAREIQCGILGNSEPQALPLVEIVSKNEFFDFKAKYDPELADEIVPAPIDEEKAQEISELSLKAFEVFGCSGLARVDTFLLEDGRVLISEINTIPGLTKDSLFPKEAAAAGISFPDLVLRIVELALEDKGMSSLG